MWMWIVIPIAYFGGWLTCLIYSAAVRSLDRLFEPSGPPAPWHGDPRQRAIAVDAAEGDPWDLPTFWDRVGREMGHSHG